MSGSYQVGGNTLIGGNGTNLQGSLSLAKKVMGFLFTCGILPVRYMYTVSQFIAITITCLTCHARTAVCAGCRPRPDWILHYPYADGVIGPPTIMLACD